MSQFRNRWREPSFILDVAQVIVSVAVAIALALDMTGIWSGIPWLSANLPSLTFIAVCVLIVSSFLERRITLDGLKEISSQKLDNIFSQQLELSEQMGEFIPTGIKLEDRRGYTVPFEVRLAHAQYVDLLSLSLAGLLSHYGGFLLTRARAGCKFRFLIVEPNSDAISTIAGFRGDATQRKLDIERSVRRLEALLETGNAELGYVSVAPPFSLLIIDPEEKHGEVQVEFYGYRVASSDLPHLLLTQAIDKRWYDFFREQFELLWEDARLHEVHGKTTIEN